jgi:hypothetical protein
VGSIRTTGAAPAGTDATASDFRPHYTLMFATLAIFLAAVLMPVEGGHAHRPQPLGLRASDSIAGGFLAVLAAWGAVTGWINVVHRKMVVWPAFYTAALGLFVVVSRAVGMAATVPAGTDLDAGGWLHLLGSGAYVILAMSLLIVWTLFSAIRAGERRAAAAAGGESAAK